MMQPPKNHLDSKVPDNALATHTAASNIYPYSTGYKHKTNFAKFLKIFL